MKEQLKYNVNVFFERIDKKTGKIISSGEAHNTVVDTGLAQLAKLVNGFATNIFHYIAIGTDNTAPATSDTSLGVQEDVKLADIDYETANKATWEATFDFVSSVIITEAGVFVTDSGIMMNRVTFDDQNVGSDVDFHIKFTLTVARA